MNLINRMSSDEKSGCCVVLLCTFFFGIIVGGITSDGSTTIVNIPKSENITRYQIAPTVEKLEVQKEVSPNISTFEKLMAIVQDNETKDCGSFHTSYANVCIKNIRFTTYRDTDFHSIMILDDDGKSVGDAYRSLTTDEVIQLAKSVISKKNIKIGDYL